MWTKNDDKSWHNRKLRRAGRSGRGLFWDLVSFSGDTTSDGWIEDVSLPQLEASLTDPDIKVLRREGLLHVRGDQCRCLDKQGWTWPKGWRGVVIHDFLDYNPSGEENAVKKAQTAELRDPELRARVRARDFGRCRYCGTATNPKDRRGDGGETLDHVDPAIAAGEPNLVIACRHCNAAKKKRTPDQAQMPLLEVVEVRGLHFAALGVTDPDLAPISNPTQVGEAGGPGRVGSGSGGVGSGQVGSGRAPLPNQLGPPTTKRDSEHPNPYLRAAHADPSLDPPPPDPPPRPAPPPPSNRTRSRRARNQKGRRRR